LLWLERLSWGANDSAARSLQRAGRARWLKEQLRPQWPAALPPDAQAQLDAMTISRVGMPELARQLEAQRKAVDTAGDEEARIAARKAYQQELSRLAREASSRSILRSLYGPGQLQDQMGWFWFNHFNVHQGKSYLRLLVGDYEDTLKSMALGRFRDLLGAVVFHPAMLIYLDNAQNAAGSPNENLGRELLELHTLGVDGGYSQDDVQALAKVLTGLGVSLSEERPKLRPEREALYFRRGLTVFNPNRHDFSDKQLLGQTITGGGVEELNRVLDMLAHHPATARHVCRKLATFLVGDEPPAALVQRLATRFLASDGRIDEVLRLLFETPEFSASLGQRFKDPVHYVYSAMRASFDGQVVANTATVVAQLARLGQAHFERQTPDGYPLESSAWSGPGQLTTRFEVARTLVYSSAKLFSENTEGMAPTPNAAPVSPMASNQAPVAVRGPTATPKPARPRGRLFDVGIAPRLSEATRLALAQASPKDADALWSPEFMRR
jgi:uncharacterized protein (DUF1800 family)